MGMRSIIGASSLLKFASIVLFPCSECFAVVNYLFSLIAVGIVSMLVFRIPLTIYSLLTCCFAASGLFLHRSCNASLDPAVFFRDVIHRNER